MSLLEEAVSLRRNAESEQDAQGLNGPADQCKRRKELDSLHVEENGLDDHPTQAKRCQDVDGHPHVLTCRDVGGQKLAPNRVKLRNHV